MLRVTEDEYAALIKRQAKSRLDAVVVKATNVPSEHNKSAQKKSLTIVLPFKLPTWNQLLAAGIWERKKIRDTIHAAVLQSIADGRDSVTRMEFQQKQLLTGLSGLE